MIQLYEVPDAARIEAVARLDDRIDLSHSRIKLYLARLANSGMDAGATQRMQELLAACIALEQAGDVASLRLAVDQAVGQFFQCGIAGHEQCIQFGTGCLRRFQTQGTGDLMQGIGPKNASARPNAAPQRCISGGCGIVASAASRRVRFISTPSATSSRSTRFWRRWPTPFLKKRGCWPVPACGCRRQASPDPFTTRTTTPTKGYRP